MAGDFRVSGRNVPAGWAAFRALRQAPAPHQPKRHGNWKHGMRSRFGIDEGRKIRVMLRILDAPRIGAVLRVPGVLAWLYPPRPMGWMHFTKQRSLAAHRAKHAY